MTVTFTPFNQAVDAAALIEFLTGNSFPFHVVTAPTIERVEKLLADGSYDDEDHKSLWVDVAGRGRVGLIVLSDLSDNGPLLDIRLAEEHRGAGLGVEVLTALLPVLFTGWPHVVRFEGQTREDNIAMRKTFLRAGFVKEAHYRDGWPVIDGEPMASIAYAVLRRDWESGVITPVIWDDLG